MNVVTVFPSFSNKGGAEDIAISVAKGICSNKPIVLHLNPIICSQYEKENVRFERFNVLKIIKYHRKGAIFLSHHRKLTTFLLLISKLLLFNKLRVVHVAHNTFSSLKRFTLFPKYNIAVSQSVKDNMVSYFGIKEECIQVIYNGIKDQFNSNRPVDRIDDKTINILYLGRIDPVKRQVDFVNATKGKIKKNVRIYFGGEGKDFDRLIQAISKDPQYNVLGLINPFKMLGKFDYVALFSEKEGLPLSLIEAQMFAKPLITNDIPQSLEINQEGVTGFVNRTWTEIIDTINNLPTPDSRIYAVYSDNSRLNYEKLFSYEKMISNYKEYLKNVK